MPDPTPDPETNGSTPSSASPSPRTSGAAPSAAVFPDLTRQSPAALGGGIDLLNDVSLQVRVELGRTTMLVEDVLRLGADSVVELDKSAGDPIDIYVNGRHIARGEVLVLNENFCVRVSEIIELLQPDEMPEAGAGPTATLRMPLPKSEVA